MAATPDDQVLKTVNEHGTTIEEALANATATLASTSATTTTLLTPHSSTTSAEPSATEAPSRNLLRDFKKSGMGNPPAELQNVNFFTQIKIEVQNFPPKNT